MSLSSWNYPTAIIAGSGALNKLPDACQSLGIIRPLLVTDPGIAALPMTQTAINLCEESGLSVTLFSDVQGNPTGENVAAGNKVFVDGHHDGIIALGGGSALDCAKAIALSAHQKHEVWQFEDIGDNWTLAVPDLIAPVIALPTTAGTGSEVGRASVITNSAEQRKVIIFHPDMVPKQVLLDPDLTLALPPHITAATGWMHCHTALKHFALQAITPWQTGLRPKGSGWCSKTCPRYSTTAQTKRLGCKCWLHLAWARPHSRKDWVPCMPSLTHWVRCTTRTMAC